MKYDLFIKTLERGRDVGFGRKFNISDILKDEFPKPITTDKNAWRAEIAVQMDVLKDMRDKLNIIKFYDIEANKVYWYDNQGNPNWFDNVTFDIWVTVTGLDYLNQYYLRQSYFGLNGTIKKNTKKQTWLLVITALVTISNLIVAIVNINSSDAKDKLSQQIQEQSKQIHTLQIMLLQKETQPFERSSAKKTLPKKF